MGRYLSGLCVAGLGVCGGGWLIMTAVLLNGAPSDAALVTLATGAAVSLASVVALWCWTLAWRRRMRRDGVLQASPGSASPRQVGRRRRALRREMRRAARAGARRGALPDSGLAGLGLVGPGAPSIASRIPEPREGDPPSPPPAPRSPAATTLVADAPGVPPYPAAGTTPGASASGVPRPCPLAASPSASAAPAAVSASAAQAATLVAELRAILEPLLAASGEDEEAW
jgi:hypothetical protein